MHRAQVQDRMILEKQIEKAVELLKWHGYSRRVILRRVRGMIAAHAIGQLFRAGSGRNPYITTAPKIR